MRKIEYRCNHCMIVETKWFLNYDNRPSEQITCQKCGLESNKIGPKEVSDPNYPEINTCENEWVGLGLAEQT